MGYYIESWEFPWRQIQLSSLFGSGVFIPVCRHYNDVIMGAIVSQITSLTIIDPTVYSDADHRKHQSSASLVFVWGIHRWSVNSPHKWPVTRKMCPFDDVIMVTKLLTAKLSSRQLLVYSIIIILSNYSLCSIHFLTPFMIWRPSQLYTIVAITFRTRSAISINSFNTLYEIRYALCNLPSTSVAVFRPWRCLLQFVTNHFWWHPKNHSRKCYLFRMPISLFLCYTRPTS